MIRLKKSNIVKEVSSELAARKLEELGYQRMENEEEEVKQENKVKQENEDPPKEPMQESEKPAGEAATSKQPKKAEKGKKEQKEDEQGGSEDNDTGLHQSNDPSGTNQADNSRGNGQQ